MRISHGSFCVALATHFSAGAQVSPSSSWPRRLTSSHNKKSMHVLKILVASDWG
jgi:hypothetical protein